MYFNVFFFFFYLDLSPILSMSSLYIYYNIGQLLYNGKQKWKKN